MAVYFAPRNSNRITINDILGMVGGRFLDSMMARDEAARQYKYRSRLDAEAAARSEAEKRGYIDMMRSGVDNNPNQQAGAADFLGGAVGAGANLQHLQNYWLPQMLTVDQGNQKTVAPAWSNGAVGDGRSYDMGVDPAKAQEMSDKLKMYNAGLAWDREQGLWERDYKNRALAQEASIRREGQRRQQPAQLMPDGKGGMVWVDPVSRSIVPAEGITPGSGGSMLESLFKASGAYKNFYGNNGGSSGQGVVDGGDGAAQPQMDPIKFLQVMGLLGNDGGVPFSDYKPLYESIGDGGLNAYSSALGGVGGPAAAGGAARSPQTAGSGGKRISMADIINEANIQNRLPADLVREAQESGFSVY